MIEEFFPEDPGLATAIFAQESQLGLAETGEESPDYGLTQINLPSHRGKVPGNTDQEKIKWLLNYENNLGLARRIYEDAGNSFRPWVAYTSGRYRDYSNIYDLIGED